MFLYDSYKKLFLFTIFFQFISMFFLYVISFIWISRIYPYFSSGIGLSFWLYITLLLQIIYISFIFLIYVVLISIYLHKIKCDKTKIINAKTIIVLSVLGVIFCTPVTGSGFWLSLQAIKRGDVPTNRCYRYVFEGLIGADSQFSNVSKYQVWRENFIKNAFDENEHLTKYLCENVSIPTLVAVLVILLDAILFIIVFFQTCNNCVFNNGLFSVNVSVNVPLTVTFSSVNQRRGYT